jgi:hypothetical protein
MLELTLLLAEEGRLLLPVAVRLVFQLEDFEVEESELPFKILEPEPTELRRRL